MKLAPGRISITDSAAVALMVADTHVFMLIARYAFGDWGRTPCDENMKAIDAGDDVIGAYILPGTGAEVWVVTNAARSTTTVMLAEEHL